MVGTKSKPVCMLLLVLFFFFFSISAMPVYPTESPFGSGSGETAFDEPTLNSTNATTNDSSSAPLPSMAPMINCSEDRLAEQGEIAVKTIFLMESTKQVLKSYAADVHDQLVNDGINCLPAVEYQSKITDTVTPKPSHLAAWYSTMRAYSSYLSHLMATMNLSNHTAGQIETLDAVLEAIENEFFDLLEGLQCNCSESCRIEEEDFDAPDNCTAELKSAVYYVRRVAEESVATMLKFLRDWSSDVPPPMASYNKRQWIEENLDPSLPAYCELLDECN